MVYSGTTFITPVLDTTTTYYVEDSIQSSQYVGKFDNSGGGSYFNSDPSHYLVFDCYSTVELVSVKVYANGAGNRTIELRDNLNTVLQSATIYIPAGESRIDLNFDIPEGNDLKLAGPSFPDLYRNDNGISYPYILSGLINIKYSSAGSDPTGYYYYFYDWEIKEPLCVSIRNPVTATIGSISVDLGADTIITAQPDTILLDAGTGYDSYFWQDSSTIQTFNVDSYGWYSVTVTDDSCDASDSIYIESPVNISDFVSLNEQIYIYPNPNKGIFNIVVKTGEKTDLIIELMNIQGQIVYRNNVKGVLTFIDEIDVSGLAKGIYYLRVNTGKQVKVEKVVVY